MSTPLAVQALLPTTALVPAYADADATGNDVIFDRNGKARLSIGLYGDNNASVVLNDEREQAVQIFRTVGERSAPVLVMKSQGRDRIVMGLNGASQDPFLVLYGVDGAKQSVFGHD